MKIRISSKWHPHGRLYRCAAVDELDATLLAELVRLHRKAESVAQGDGLLARLKMGWLIDAAVRIVVPDLEPRVLRRLSLASRRRILTTWTEAQQ